MNEVQAGRVTNAAIRLTSQHVRPPFVYVLTLARLSLRAFAFAGRFPWLAFLSFRCGFAMSMPLGG